MNTIKVFNKKTKIATWDIRSLFKTGKLANVEHEMSHLKIEVLSFTWPNSRKLKKTDHEMIYFLGSNDSHHRYKVAIHMAENLAHSVADFVLINDHVMLLRTCTSWKMMNVIQVYTPTSQKLDKDVEQLHTNVEKVFK